jgi:hypothetical protein
VALLVLGRVVAGVLLEIAFLAGDLDLVGDLDAATRREILVLGPESLEGGSRQLRCSPGESRLSGPDFRPSSIVAAL